MKKSIKQFEILSIKRGNNSYYGNPSYFVGLADAENNFYYAKTKSNAAIGYSLPNFKTGDTVNITYHFTANGNMILDQINN